MSAEPDEFFLPFYRSGNTITHMNDPEIDALLTRITPARCWKTVRRSCVRNRPEAGRFGDQHADCSDVEHECHAESGQELRAAAEYCFVLWDTYIEETTT